MPLALPGDPQNRTFPRNLALGLFGGLVLGAAFIVFREGTDGSIRTPGSVPLHLNLRELGVIPSAITDPELPGMSGRKVAGALPAATRNSSWSALRRTLDKRDSEPVELGRPGIERRRSWRSPSAQR